MSKSIAADWNSNASAPWCSLITVTYQSSATLRRFWRDSAIPDGIEWIVVDNGSTDGSADLAEELGARVLRQQKNLGFGGANNVGLRAAHGRFIGFVNPDVAIRYGDLESLAAVAHSNKALVAPQLMNPDDSRQPNGRGYPFLWDKIRNRLGRSQNLNGRYNLYGRNKQPTPVCWVMGACVFGDREDIDRLNGWDQRFFLYYEDKDLCLRAWASGISVVLVPSVQWTHGWARETTSPKLGPWKREFASMYKFYRRYPEFLAGRSLASRRHPEIEREVFGSAG